MTRFILSRLSYLALVVFSVVTLLFFLLRLSGDPAVLMVGVDPRPERLDQVRQEFGLDQPLPVQYAVFVQKALQLDFGRSYRSGQPAFQVVSERLPATLQLAAAAILLTLVVAFPVGVLAALRRGSLSGFLVMLGALLGQSIPGFWLAILLILLFSVEWRLLPSFGSGGIEHLIMPSVTLAAFLAARQARLVRSGMLEVLGQDYIRTARAKGLSEARVVVVHAMRNMLLPIVAVLGLDISALIGGSVITETVFSWPGLGQLMVTSVIARDYAVVQAAVFVTTSGVVAVNLLIDALYRVLDPQAGLR